MRARNTTSTAPGSTAPGFRWGPSTRIGLWATLASAAIGIIFGILQVQGWTVPKALALVLISLLSLVLVGAVGMALYEFARVLLRFAEHRKTTPSWVEAEPPGHLDFPVDGPRAMGRFTAELNALTTITERLNEKIVKSSKRIERIAPFLPPRPRRWMVNRPAKRIEKTGVYIQKRVELLKEVVRDIHRNYDGFISDLTLDSEEERQAAQGLRDTLASGRQTTRSTIESNEDYLKTVRDLQEQNPSRALRLACRELGDGLQGFLTVLKLQEKRGAELVRTFDQRLGDQ